MDTKRRVFCLFVFSFLLFGGLFLDFCSPDLISLFYTFIQFISHSSWEQLTCSHIYKTKVVNSPWTDFGADGGGDGGGVCKLGWEKVTTLLSYILLY